MAKFFSPASNFERFQEGARSLFATQQPPAAVLDEDEEERRRRERERKQREAAATAAPQTTITQQPQARQQRETWEQGRQPSSQAGSAYTYESLRQTAPQFTGPTRADRIRQVREYLEKTSKGIGARARTGGVGTPTEMFIGQAVGTLTSV